MKFRLKSAMAGVVTAAIFLGVTGIAQVAQAATPPYEPDPNTNGTLTFFDASGNVKTTGNPSDAPFAAYIQASASGHATADTKATLFGYLPKNGQATGAFSGEQMSAATTYPNSAAPANLASSPLPLVTSAPTDRTLAALANDFPNVDTTSAYAGLYQLRVKTSNPNTIAVTYEDASVFFQGCTFTTTGTTCAANATWTQVYPVAASTTTALTASPPSPQNQGTTVNLTATVTPSTATGSVQFMDGTTAIGAAVPVSGGTASTSTSTLSAGTHSLTAVFTSSAPGSFTNSTSPAQSYTIVGPAQGTTTGLTVNPGSSTANQPVTFTATVSPSNAPGSVTFQDFNGTTTTTVGTTPSGSGTFVYTTSSLGAGSHTITATFNPTDPTAFKSSSATAAPFTLAAPAFGNSDVQSIQTSIGNGTLNVSTPYHSANPLVLGQMVLNANATQYSVTGTFSGITITDTRAGNLPWTVTGLSSNLTSGSNVINSQNVGMTGLVAVPIAGNALPGAAGNITTTDNPAANPAVGPTAAGSAGLGGATPHTMIHANNGAGSISYNGTLTINAPTSSGPGTYNGTITFTIG